MYSVMLLGFAFFGILFISSFNYLLVNIENPASFPSVFPMLPGEGS